MHPKTDESQMGQSQNNFRIHTEDRTKTNKQTIRAARTVRVKEFVPRWLTNCIVPVCPRQAPGPPPPSPSPWGRWPSARPSRPAENDHRHATAATTYDSRGGGLLGRRHPAICAPRLDAQSRPDRRGGLGPGRPAAAASPHPSGTARTPNRSRGVAAERGPPRRGSFGPPGGRLAAADANSRE